MTWARTDHAWVLADLAELQRTKGRALRGLACTYLRLCQWRAIGGVEPFPKNRQIAAALGWSTSAVSRLLSEREAWQDPEYAAEWARWEAENLCNVSGTSAVDARDACGTESAAGAPAIAEPRDVSGTLAGRERDVSGHTRGNHDKDMNRDKTTPLVTGARKPAPLTDGDPVHDAVGRLWAVWLTVMPDTPLPERDHLFPILRWLDFASDPARAEREAAEGFAYVRDGEPDDNRARTEAGWLRSRGVDALGLIADRKNSGKRALNVCRTLAPAWRKARDAPPPAARGRPIGRVSRTDPTMTDADLDALAVAGFDEPPPRPTPTALEILDADPSRSADRMEGPPPARWAHPAR